jgi:hypothetical protein
MTREEFSKKYPYNSGFQNPYLVQRLKLPTETAIGKVRVDQIFAFGGGGSGLSPEAWEILKPLFEFDYMGAAEFEFGAFPKSLSKMLKKPLVTYQLELSADDHKGNPARNWGAKGPAFGPKAGGTVYVICQAGHEEFTKDAIHGYAMETLHTKEYVGLAEALDPTPNVERKAWNKPTVGWYELPNGFFFFTDKPMYERTLAVFMNAKQSP